MYSSKHCSRVSKKVSRPSFRFLISTEIAKNGSSFVHVFPQLKHEVVTNSAPPKRECATQWQKAGCVCVVCGSADKMMNHSLRVEEISK